MSGESIFFFLVSLLLFAIIATLRSITIRDTDLSEYELTRRVHNGDEEAVYIAQRQVILPDVITLRHVLDVFLAVLMVTSLLHAFGWFVGITIALVALLELSMVARQNSVRRFSQPLYDLYEDYILIVADKLHPLLRFVREVGDSRPIDFKVHSREELLHIIDEAKDVLNNEERHLLSHAMKFETKTVAEIMTPRGVVETINQDEVLGPVVLDRLHKTGHSRFPVINGTIDHIVGLLYSHQLLMQVGNGHKITAEKVMEKKVFYINESQTLDSALAGFLRVKHHLFIVVNEFEETTGVITIEDTIEALIGRKIVDEFDQHDDLRAVAKRVAKTRNKSAHSTHIS